MRGTREAMYRVVAVVASSALVLAVACGREPFEPGVRVDPDVTVSGGQVLIGAGDIAACGNPNDEATADLVDSLLVEHPEALVFTAGDNVYEDGTAQEYAQCYDPSWGRFKDRTWATIGNHEYNLGDADPTFDYFGERIGPRDLGYYSVDVGNWHLVMLNSNNGFVPLDPGSAQDQWLRADLAANTKACVLAVFHHPRFYSSNTQGSFASTRVKPFWDALYEYGADLVVVGHAHHYERFAPQDPEGNLDLEWGIRQFIVGTGGRSVGVKDYAAPNSEIRNDEGAYGVIKLTLHETSYEWEFIHTPGFSFSDSGSGTCTGAGVGPVADFTWVEDPDLTLTFADASSGTVTAWSWTFGDGVTSTSQNPTHTYDAAGVYTVTLTVTDDNDLTSTASREVTAGPQAPVADFTWADNGLSVDFTDTSSDVDGSVSGWSWDFGDGATSTAQNPSHAYPGDGSYTVTLTVTDDDGLTGTTTQTVSATSRTSDMIYVATSGSGVVGGVDFDDEDILAYDAETDTWSLYFDGSDVGLDGTNDRDLRAFALLANGDILLSLHGQTSLPDVGSVDPSDVLRFSGSTGANTSGSFSHYLRGADVGLTGEELDGISFAPDGRLVVSTAGSFSVPGASGSDEDLIVLDAGGTWSLYFDGSDVGLSDSSGEDVAGIWIDELTGDIYLSTRGAFSVPGVSGDSTTIFICSPGSLGSSTSCTFTSYWVGSLHGLADSEVLGIHIGKPTAPANVPPTADLEYTCGDLDCEFNDASTDSDGTVVAWTWDFGDGQTSTARDPSHTYATAGDYTVALTVEDDDGATSTATQVVTVETAPEPNQAPTANFSWSATDLEVDFTDTSTDSDGTVASWSWAFGDGMTSTLQNPTHTYAAAGDYTVSLAVTDDDGATSTVTQTVTVTAEPPPTNQPPTASFSWSATNLEVDFTDISTDPDGTIISWSWAFGDGMTSTLQNPTQTYAAAGDYTVSLTVTDDDGATSTAAQTLTVTTPPPPNSAPTANFTFAATDLTVNFTDTSTDTDGTIGAWNWDFGDGAGASSAQSPSYTYSATGDYTVTLTVTDDDGATSTATQVVEVEAITGSVHVLTPAGSNGYSTSGGKNSDRHLDVTVTLVNQNGTPVAGASVSATISGPTPAGGTGTTDSSGQLTFRITNAQSGTYTTTVTAVTAAGLNWDGTTPPNSFNK